jgi:polysaccharide export outer membrane protein
MSSRTVIALVFGLFTASVGCKPNHPYVWADEYQAGEAPLENVELRSGDTIAIAVSRMEELRTAEPFVVGADGTVVLPLVGPFRVAGMTPKAAALALNTRLNGLVVNPDARISVVTPRAPLVSVVGEVRAPGRFDLGDGQGVLAALALAGGLTEFANRKGIYVVRKYPKHTRVRFRYDDLVGGVERSTKFELRDGDVVVVE